MKTLRGVIAAAAATVLLGACASVGKVSRGNAGAATNVAASAKVEVLVTNRTDHVIEVAGLCFPPGTDGVLLLPKGAEVQAKWGDRALGPAITLKQDTSLDVGKADRDGAPVPIIVSNRSDEMARVRVHTEVGNEVASVDVSPTHDCGFTVAAGQIVSVYKGKLITQSFRARENTTIWLQ